MSIKALVSANYNFIKGQLGEAIVERLFTSLGMHICRYGYEITTPSILLLKKQGHVGTAAIKRINFHPDFIVIKYADAEAPNGHSFKIEVKYSYYGRIHFDHVRDYDDDVYFLFLDNENFWIAHKLELDDLKQRKKTGSFSFKDIAPLENYGVFNFTPDQINTIKAFKRFLEATYGNLSKHKEILETIEKDFETTWDKIQDSQTKEQCSDIEEYFQDTDLEFDPQIGELARAMNSPQNAGQHWTEAADKELQEKYISLCHELSIRNAIKRLSVYFRRSPGAIRARLVKLELISPAQRAAFELEETNKKD